MAFDMISPAVFRQTLNKFPLSKQNTANRRNNSFKDKLCLKKIVVLQKRTPKKNL
jgi:hypothetical protein